MSKKNRNKNKIAKSQISDESSNQIKYIWEKYTYHIILSMLVIIAYFNSLSNDFLSDDIFGIVQNPNISKWSNVTSQPLRFFQPLLYYILFHLNGLNPELFRLVNILSHIGSVNLIFAILVTIVSPLVAFIAAAIFAVHPLLGEPVVWVSGGTFAWYTFFFLCSFYFYLKATTHKFLYPISLFFFFLSNVVGVPAIVLSGVFVIYELSFGDIRSRWKIIIPYFLISMFFVFFAFAGLGGRLESINSNFSQRNSTYNPFLQIPFAISSYISLYLWPSRLTLYHSELRMDLLDYILRFATMVTIFAATAWAYFKNKFIFFGLAIFILSLLPTLTPFSVAWVVAERYVYFGTIGLVFITAYLLSKLVKLNEGIFYAILVSVLIILTIRTISRNIDWKNEDNLWVATAKTSPSDPKTHNNLGDMYVRHKNLQKAEEEFKLAILLNPAYADAYHNLGNVYRLSKRNDLAVKSYQKALELNPNLWQSSLNLATIAFEQKQFQEAEKFILQSIKANPTYARLHLNLGIIYFQLKEPVKAKEALDRALALDPNDPIIKQAISKLSQ